MAKRIIKELAKIPEDLKNLPFELAKLSSGDLSWKSSLDLLAALLRKTIIFDNFVLYKSIRISR